MGQALTGIVLGSSEVPLGLCRDVKTIFYREELRQAALRELAETMAYVDSGDRSRWKDYIAQTVADTKAGIANRRESRLLCG